MTTSPQRRIANRITHPTPDVGTRTPQLRTGIAVRPILGTETPLDADGTDTGAGYPCPGWWVTLDGIDQALPIVTGGEGAIEPGRPVWVILLNGSAVILGGQSIGMTDYPDWLDDPPKPATHGHAWYTGDITGVPTATETTLNWVREFAWGGDLIASPSATTFRIPFDGLWDITAQVQWPDNTNGSRIVTIKRATNVYGSAVVQEAARDRRNPVTGGYTTTHQLSTGALPYIAEDTVWVTATQTAGGGLYIGPDTATWIRLHYIGPGPIRARSADVTRSDRVQATWL